MSNFNYDGNLEKDAKRAEEELSHIKPETEKKIEKMVETWDIVKCKICRKKISMLNARAVNNGEYFVCKSH